MKKARYLTPDDARFIERKLAKAVRLFDKGQYPASGNEASRILKKYPDCSPALQLMGAICAELGRHEEAVGYLRRGVADDPADAGAHFNLGKTLQMAGRLADARAALAEAIRLSPRSAQFVAEYGTVSLELGEVEEAENAYRRSLELDPRSVDARYNYGQLCVMQARNEEAVGHLEAALALNAGLFEAHAGLAKALQALGRFDEALAHCLQSLALQPGYVPALAAFAETAMNSGAVADSGDFRGLVRQCFESPRVDSSAVRGASEKLLRADLKDHLEAGAVADGDVAGLDGRTGGLLSAHLKSAFIACPDLEALLTGVRASLLRRRCGRERAEAAFDAELPLLEALAYQGFLNEYVWHAGDEEDAMAGALEAEVAAAAGDGSRPAAADLYLLAAYRPLHANDAIRQWAIGHLARAKASLRPFLVHMVANPAKEAAIAARLEQLTDIDDAVSLAVRAQYEANPYPRWDSVTVSEPVAYTQMIAGTIAPHRPVLGPASEHPMVLVAGCGTGRQPIATALQVRNAALLAVDLSRASLAYARRRAEEMKVANIRFAQADILKLGVLEERFDAIECGGVLHHMADPEAGLKVLVGLLKPGGFMLLGLYSEVARQDIVRLRQWAADKGFEPTVKGIRAFRRALRDAGGKDAPAIPRTSDFYTTSTVRDLVFHVQEHRFTLPRIKALLDDTGLEFLGFSLPNPLVKQAYRERFPGDPDCLDLDNWDRFERDNPRTFEAMYQFWCRKPA